jgi:imidazolonepropionase-like amidohydrolase
MTRVGRASSWLLSLALLALCSVAPADPEPARSPGGEPGRVHALVGATIVPAPGQRIERGTILIRDGLIESIGPAVEVPADAQVWDLSGRTVYPGLVEPYLRLGARPDAKAKPQAAPSPSTAHAGGATHPNPKVRAHHDVARGLRLEAEALAGLRKAGFTAALVAPEAGIFRGTSALVALRDGSPREQVVEARVAQHLAFEYGGWGSRGYPNSLMGAMALARQTLLDAEHNAAAWDVYRRRPLGAKRPKSDESLKALGDALSGQLPVCLEVRDAGMLLRGANLLREFELVPWVVLGTNDAPRWLDEVRGSEAELILSLNYAPLPIWESEGELPDVSHAALRAWHEEPAAPGRLERAGVSFAFTSQGLKDRTQLLARVREAIARGLSENAALAALTTVPSRLLGAPQLGKIRRGAAANLTVSVGPLFDEASVVTEVWVEGLRYPTRTELPTPKDLAGRWRLSGPGEDLELELKHERGALSGAVVSQKAGVAGPALGRVELWRDRLRLQLPASSGGLILTLRGRPPLLEGRQADGPLLLRKLAPKPKPPEEGEPAPQPLRPLDLPVRAPWPPLPEARPRALIVRGATIWTSGPKGTLADTDLLVVKGVIRALGKDLPVPKGGARLVDGKGLHITPGIVDCHSHSFGVGPVNESTNSCTAEVRCEDVIDPDTIQIYRQLAGGVTAAMQLHGSANSIGGQSAVVRLRWGEPADGLLFRGAAPGIKFALGENPKRSNWGEGLAPRYPTSRMGVNESIRERLLAARAYRDELQRWKKGLAQGRVGVPPRIDLQLEALTEVLSGRRKVHSHSYRQDEILALIRLAEELGFTVGTFQHVLEGYKVADALAAHGAGASTFSDWWAYKFEVIDAIAYNAALMQRRGVLVSLKSDSSEMARRLNQEAAKAVRYGGAKPAQAMAMVTRNPAQQLGIADRVGSLEVGKEADFVIWSGSPLATTSRCQATYIQGRPYWDYRRDSAARGAFAKERRALIELARRARHADAARLASDWQTTFPKGSGGSAEEGHSAPHAQGICCRGGAR